MERFVRIPSESIHLLKGRFPVCVSVVLDVGLARVNLGQSSKMMRMCW